jgi:LysM repeat protein
MNTRRGTLANVCSIDEAVDISKGAILRPASSAVNRFLVRAESIVQISERHYGSTRFAPALAAHNNLVGHYVVAGSEIELPTIKYLESEYGDRKPYAWRFREYIVLPGDTLIEIAQREMNNPVYYKRLAEINRIKNPSIIYAGQKLLIPRVDSYDSGTSLGDHSPNPAFDFDQHVFPAPPIEAWFRIASDGERLWLATPCKSTQIEVELSYDLGVLVKELDHSSLETAVFFNGKKGEAIEKVVVSAIRDSILFTNLSISEKTMSVTMGGRTTTSGFEISASGKAKTVVDFTLDRLKLLNGIYIAGEASLRFEFDPLEIQRCRDQQPSPGPVKVPTFEPNIEGKTYPLIAIGNDEINIVIESNDNQEPLVNPTVLAAIGVSLIGAVIVMPKLAAAAIITMLLSPTVLAEKE